MALSRSHYSLSLLSLLAILSDAFVPRSLPKAVTLHASQEKNSIPFEPDFGYSDGSSFFNETTISGISILDELRIAQAKKGNVPMLDPSVLEFIPTCDAFNQECSLESANLFEDQDDEYDHFYPYVDMIRSSGPYIANHRGELVVLHIPGDLLIWDDLTDLMNDIALCWLLGMKIVIVVGCRRQVDDRLAQMGSNHKAGHTRITSKEQMRIISEEAGFARFEVERTLHRSLRCSQLSSSSDGNVVSGNFFAASPFGVVDGVDHQATGRPKHLNVKRVLDYLQDGEIVLMTSVGISHDGEAINVNSECLASFVASSLCANKVVYCANNGMVLRNKETQSTVQNFRTKEASEILSHFNLNVRKNYYLNFTQHEELPPGAAEMLIKLGWANRALQDGVERAHIIAPSNGALIEELFTAKQGSGTCISSDSFESVHPDDDSGDFELANEFTYVLNSDDDPDWPKKIPKQDFPWQSKTNKLS